MDIYKPFYDRQPNDTWSKTYNESIFYNEYFYIVKLPTTYQSKTTPHPGYVGHSRPKLDFANSTSFGTHDNTLLGKD